jgi:hypothetical protein
VLIPMLYPGMIPLKGASNAHIAQWSRSWERHFACIFKNRGRFSVCSVRRAVEVHSMRNGVIIYKASFGSHACGRDQGLLNASG